LLKIGLHLYCDLCFSNPCQPLDLNNTQFAKVEDRKTLLNLGNMTQATQSQKQGIQLSETALTHLTKLREEQGKDLCLRVGVRNGGCSGMSYLMDFEDPTNVREDDEVFDYDGFKIICDPKSLLYIYGLQLDYSNALIGGGFQFTNPNASQTCGCGKSFGV
jgi:iron-sulfur cluster assembly protein